MASDPRFASEPGRYEHRTSLDKLLSEYTRERSDAELFQTLQDRGVIAGPVQNDADAFACPQLDARGFFEELPSDSYGTRRYPGLIFSMANTPNRLRRVAPQLGQDNDYVYRDVLGYSETEYRRAQESGQAGLGYAPGVVPWLNE